MAISAPEHDASFAQGRPDGAARARTESLYAAHARSVSAICRALLRDRSEAEDAAQQVFLSAHRALLNGSAPREPGAWLATIARNECWARIRARMREPLAVADVDEVAALPDPVSEAINRCDLDAFWAATGELPRQQRDALLLRELGGLTYEQVAAALAVTTPAVESLLFRARQRLRERLQAAYASLSDGSWLPGLGRLIGGTAPAAATKAVALGLGTATVATGTFVATPMLERHARPHPTAHAAAAIAPLRHRLPATATAPISFSLPAAPSRTPHHEEASGPARAEPVDRHEHSGDGTSGASGDSSPETTGGSSSETGGDSSGGSGGDSSQQATAADPAPAESSGDSGGDVLATPSLAPAPVESDGGALGGDAVSSSDG